MNSQDQANKWQQVANLITELGLVTGDADAPRTAAQVTRMPIT